MIAPRVRGPAAVRTAFTEAQRDDRAAFIAYLMAGFPNEATSVEAAMAAVEGGADIIEIGIPFSDPVADGPVIADAGRVALARGGGFGGAVSCIRTLRERGMDVPILAMSYLNPIVAVGARASLSALAEAGASGLIVPDLPAGESPATERLAGELDLAISFLVAPNTSAERIERAARASTGFLYVVPLFGVTGARERLADSALTLLARVRAAAGGHVPMAAGFGISRPDQVAALAGFADGVVVGSALVRALAAGDPPRRVGELVRSLAAATRVSRARAAPGAAPAGHRVGSRPGRARSSAAHRGPRR